MYLDLGLNLEHFSEQNNVPTYRATPARAQFRFLIDKEYCVQEIVQDSYLRIPLFDFECFHSWYGLWEYKKGGLWLAGTPLHIVILGAPACNRAVSNVHKVHAELDGDSNQGAEHS